MSDSKFEMNYYGFVLWSNEGWGCLGNLVVWFSII